MASPRDHVPERVSAVLGGRPTRWAPADRLVGDYDGRERTLEIFDADPSDQRRLLRQLRSLRPEIEETVGGPLIVLFHTTIETARLYPEIPGLRRGYPELASRVGQWLSSSDATDPYFDPDGIHRFAFEAV